MQLAEELTSRRARHKLARSARGIVGDLSPRFLPGASPLNRPLVRPHADLLLVLADRLDRDQRPVSLRGMLAVRQLLQDPSSPLYAEADAVSSDTVAAAIEIALAQLNAR